MSPSKCMSHVTCHMTPMAHGHGVRCSLHRLQQPERGFKDSVITKREVKL